MATKKVKRKPAKRKAGSERKKAESVRRTAPRRKAAAKKTAKKTGATAKRPAAKKAAPKSVARTSKPKPPARQKTAKPTAPSAGVPAAPEGAQLVGTVVHFYNHLMVGVVRVDRDALRTGDTIRILGHTTDLTQRIESMEVNHQKIETVGQGQEFGLKVSGHVREHDLVYRVLQP